MELASFGYSSISCNPINNPADGRCLSLKCSKALLRHKAGILCSGTRSNSHLDSTKPSKLYPREGFRLLGLLEKLRNHSGGDVASSNGNNHSTSRDVSTLGVPGAGEVQEVSKVRIPGLPQESSGPQGSPITSCFWEWRPKLLVHYEKSGPQNLHAPAVLFLPGFGVGSFHYEKQLKDLGRDYRVWALDFLGQGKSLPSEDPAPSNKEGASSEYGDEVWGVGEQTEPWARELAYSIDLWRDQVQNFIEQVIGEPVYIVGNSLGGYVALYSAASNPQLVNGVTLLNATPFWGFLPNPSTSPRLSKLFPWAGTFPIPSSVRKLNGLVWQKVSEPRNIQEILKQVYADPSTKVDDVVVRIIETTRHPAAAASFASIMFAPKGQMSFNEALSRCKLEGVPICLMYGREDPWVRPVWGLQVKQQLPEAPYYEISPAGHCPHSEVPEVINFLLRGWIKNLESQGSVALPLLEEQPNQYVISKELEYMKEGSWKLVRVRFLGSKFSLRALIISSFAKLLIPNFQNHSR